MGRKPTKLTDKDVCFIRSSDLSQNQLARMFGVSQGHINDIIHIKRRREVFCIDNSPNKDVENFLKDKYKSQEEAKKCKMIFKNKE